MMGESHIAVETPKGSHPPEHVVVRTSQQANLYMERGVAEDDPEDQSELK